MRLISRFKIPELIGQNATFVKCGGNKIALGTCFHQYIFSMDGELINRFDMSNVLLYPTPDGYIVCRPKGLASSGYIGEVEVYGDDGLLKGCFKAGRFAVGANGSFTIIPHNDNRRDLWIFDSNCVKKYDVRIEDEIGDIDALFIAMYDEDRLAVICPHDYTAAYFRMIAGGKMGCQVWLNFDARIGLFCNKGCLVLRDSIVRPIGCCGALVFFEDNKMNRIVIVYKHAVLCNLGKYPLVAEAPPNYLIDNMMNKLATIVSSPVVLYELDGSIWDSYASENRLVLTTLAGSIYVFDTTLDNDTDRYISVAAVKSMAS